MILYKHHDPDFKPQIASVNDFIKTFNNSVEERAKITVLVAMSGGVDSSVLAVLLHKAGFNVIGITFQLYDIGKVALKKGACCAGIDIYDAQKVSQDAGFKHYILNKETKFNDSVIQTFIDSYFKGETPLPCASCNQELKIPYLLELRKKLGADIVMTGHYARIFIAPTFDKNMKSEQNQQRVRADQQQNEMMQYVNIQQKYYLYKGKDIKKDQTYFLGGLTQENLQVLDFPLGHITKDITRKLAEELNVHIAQKPDSQDICFIPNNNYAEFIRKNRPEASQKGDILHIDGYKLGEHNGIIDYTVGQRKGLGLSHPTPLYVVDIQAENALIIVGPYSALEKYHVYLHKINIVGNIDSDKVYTAKLRSTGKLLDCYIRPSKFHLQGNVETSKNEVDVVHDKKIVDNCVIELITPDFGVSPGQVCIVYDEERVVMSGTIYKKK